MTGAFFHFISRRNGKGIMCAETASLYHNRPFRDTSDKAITKLEQSRTGKKLSCDFEWQGWAAIGASKQIALYRPKPSMSVALTDLVHFVDEVSDIRKLGEVKVTPLLVLDGDGFSFLGINGHCISVRRNQQVRKHGLPSQVKS